MLTRSLAATAALAVALGLVAFAPAPTATAASACPAPATTLLKNTGGGSGKRIALTLDDGPSRFTPKVLRILKRNNVRATFFMTGREVNARPALARRIVREGHVVGNHTYTHPQAAAGSKPYGPFDRLSMTEQRRQVDQTTQTFQRVLGVTPCVFRAPAGKHFAPATVAMLAQKGMSTAHWRVAGRDAFQARSYSRSSTRSIVRNATRAPGGAPILLLHDGKASPEPESQVTSFRGNTVRALPRIIGYYKQRGYAFTDVRGKRI